MHTKSFGISFVFCPFHDLGKYKDKDNIWWDIPRDLDKDQMQSQVHG